METEKKANKQLCVWEGTLVGTDKIKEFEEFFKNEFNVDVEYLEEFLTLPDETPDSGGRNDVLFYVEMGKNFGNFCTARLEWGIRWYEDFVAPYNGSRKIIPKRILEKYNNNE